MVLYMGVNSTGMDEILKNDAVVKKCIVVIDKEELERFREMGFVVPILYKREVTDDSSERTDNSSI